MFFLLIQKLLGIYLDTNDAALAPGGGSSTLPCCYVWAQDGVYHLQPDVRATISPFLCIVGLFVMFCSQMPPEKIFFQIVAEGREKDTGEAFGKVSQSGCVCQRQLPAVDNGTGPTRSV